MQWFGIYMYCELIATIALLNNYHHTSLCIFFLVMRTFKTQILKKILRVIFFFFFWVSVCPPSFCLLSRLSRNSVVCPEEIQFSLLCSPWSDCISGCQFILTIASGVTFEWISNNNRLLTKLQATACCSVTKSCLTLTPHGLQHARLPCPSLSSRACSNSCPSSWWCHPTISSSVVPFSSALNLSQHQGLF